MEVKKVLKDSIETLASYQKKQESFRKIFVNEPVMAKAIEVFDSAIYSMFDYIFDLLEMPSEEFSDKYSKTNWTRNVSLNLIKMAAENEKYIDAAIELVADWKNLSNYTAKVESHSWFHYEHLLAEHLVGYKNQAVKKDKEKK